MHARVLLHAVHCNLCFDSQIRSIGARYILCVKNLPGILEEQPVYRKLDPRITIFKTPYPRIENSIPGPQSLAQYCKSVYNYIRPTDYKT